MRMNELEWWPHVMYAEKMRLLETAESNAEAAPSSSPCNSGLTRCESSVTVSQYHMALSNISLNTDLSFLLVWLKFHLYIKVAQ